MYIFNHAEIAQHALHQIEYSIIDSCNKNCRSCSHFSPLAKRANLVSVSEFTINAGILHEVVPDVHMFWLTGGEPTLHPEYMKILERLRNIYSNVPVGIMSNGYSIIKNAGNRNFWAFIRANKIIWRITTYNILPQTYIDLFVQNNCIDLLSLDENKTFSNLIVLTNIKQQSSIEKYKQCGWERMNIFVRNGCIWKCPAVEYIDLFNNYFNKRLLVHSDDYLHIQEGLTRSEIIKFKGVPSSFCCYCDLTKRHTIKFPVEESKRKISEWMVG